MNVEPAVEDVLGLLHADLEVVERGKKRQEAVWEETQPDYLPLLVANGPVAEKERYPTFDKKEQYYDKEKMFMELLWGLIGAARTESDVQLSMPVDLGAGFIPSILGLKQMVFTDKDPWLKDSLTKKQIAETEVADLKDIADRGLMPKALQYCRFFRQKLQGKARVCLCGDMFWGPFSIAHLIRRDDLFTDLYDDPSFVHHLMEIATHLYIETVKAMKACVGEPLDTGYRRELYISDGGVICNEDTMILIAREHVEEFVYPYLRRALKAFGGGVVHFCGNGKHLLDSLLEIPEVKGINLGDTQMYDYGDVMGLVLERGKAYYGGWRRREREETEAYLARILKPLQGRKQGLILTYALTPEEQKNPQEVMRLWHRLQDRSAEAREPSQAPPRTGAPAAPESTTDFVFNASFRRRLRQSPHHFGEVAYLESILRPGMIVIDVGANRGVTAAAMARAVGEKGYVYAFEPVAEYSAALERNVARSNIRNIGIHTMALSDRNAPVPFYAHGEGSGIVAVDHAAEIEVHATTLTEFAAREHVARIDFINLDCEGSELLVLRGAGSLLKEQTPLILCEVHRDYLRELGQSIEDLASFLTAIGYSVKPVQVEDPNGVSDLSRCSHICAAVAGTQEDGPICP